MLRRKIRKDNRFEFRLSGFDLEKINYLVRRLGFNNRSQLLIHLVNAAFDEMSVCNICGGEIIEMVEQNGQKEGWFLCSKCGHDYSLEGGAINDIV